MIRDVREFDMDESGVNLDFFHSIGNSAPAEILNSAGTAKLGPCRRTAHAKKIQQAVRNVYG